MTQAERLREELEYVKDKRAQHLACLDEAKVHNPSWVKGAAESLSYLNRSVERLTRKLARVGG